MEIKSFFCGISGYRTELWLDNFPFLRLSTPDAIIEGKKIVEWFFSQSFAKLNYLDLLACSVDKNCCIQKKSLANFSRFTLNLFLQFFDMGLYGISFNFFSSALFALLHIILNIAFSIYIQNFLLQIYC